MMLEVLARKIKTQAAEKSLPTRLMNQLVKESASEGGTTFERLLQYKFSLKGATRDTESTR